MRVLIDLDTLSINHRVALADMVDALRDKAELEKKLERVNTRVYNAKIRLTNLQLGE